MVRCNDIDQPIRKEAKHLGDLAQLQGMDHCVA